MSTQIAQRTARRDNGPAQEPGSGPRYVTDKVMAAMIGVSASLLQMDRKTTKRIPVVRIGTTRSMTRRPCSPRLKLRPLRRSRRARTAQRSTSDSQS